MTKWDYIRLISKHALNCDGKGGVLDLLQWCDKPNTAAVTEDEAKRFWEEVLKSGEETNVVITS